MVVKLTESNGEREETDTEAQKGDRSRVGESGTELPSDLSLGTEVQTLESFWRQSQGVLKSISHLLIMSHVSLIHLIVVDVRAGRHFDGLNVRIDVSLMSMNVSGSTGKTS